MENNSYQFIHIEMYSMTASKKQTSKTKAGEKKWNVSEVLGEALRQDGHCSHVENPVQPIVIGKPIDELIKNCQSILENNKDPLGRKLRSDTTVLLSGVASYKLPDEVSMDQCIDSEHYKKWKKQTIRFLKQRYGKNLVSIVEHVDESHPHCHFYVINPKGSVRLFHDGWKAVENQKPEWEGIKDKKEQKRMKDKIYCQGMKNYQNQYNEFMKPLGYLRDGPKRARLSRNEWKEWKSYNAKLASLKSEIKKTEQLAKEKLEEEYRKIETGMVGKVAAGVKNAWQKLSNPYQEQCENLKNELSKFEKENFKLYDKMAKNEKLKMDEISRLQTSLSEEKKEHEATKDLLNVANEKLDQKARIEKNASKNNTKKY